MKSRKYAFIQSVTKISIQLLRSRNPYYWWMIHEVYFLIYIFPANMPYQAILHEFKNTFTQTFKKFPCMLIRYENYKLFLPLFCKLREEFASLSISAILWNVFEENSFHGCTSPLANIRYIRYPKKYPPPASRNMICQCCWSSYNKIMFMLTQNRFYRHFIIIYLIFLECCWSHINLPPHLGVG